MSFQKIISSIFFGLLAISFVSLPVYSATNWIFDSSNKLLYSDGTDTKYIFGGSQTNGWNALINTYSESRLANFNLVGNSNGAITWQKADGKLLYEHTILGPDKDVYSFAGSSNNTNAGFDNVFFQANRNRDELTLNAKTRIMGGLGSTLKEVAQTTDTYQMTTDDYTIIVFDNNVGSIGTRTIFLPSIQDFPNQRVEIRRKGTANNNKVIIKPHTSNVYGGIFAKISTINSGDLLEMELPTTNEVVILQNNASSFWYQLQ